MKTINERELLILDDVMLFNFNDSTYFLEHPSVVRFNMEENGSFFDYKSREITPVVIELVLSGAKVKQIKPCLDIKKMAAEKMSVNDLLKVIYKK